MKPRCPSCDQAMKRPYHRTGAEGKWEGIASWWYCQSCNFMEENLSNLLPENIQEYLNKAMDSMSKPRINYYSEGLVTIQRQIQKFHEAPESSQEYFRYNFGKEPKTAFYKAQDHYRRQKKLALFWICEVCDEMIETDPMINLMGKKVDELDQQEKQHCDKPMKLGVHDALLLSYRRRQQGHLEQIETLPPDAEDEISVHILLFLLNMFYFEDLQDLKKYVIAWINSTPDVQEYWGFQYFKLLVELLTRRSKIEDIQPYMLIELVNKGFYFNDEPSRLQNVRTIFNDMVIAARQVDISLSLDMRRITNHLFSKMTDGITFGLIQELVPDYYPPFVKRNLQSRAKNKSKF